MTKEEEHLMALTLDALLLSEATNEVQSIEIQRLKGEITDDEAAEKKAAIANTLKAELHKPHNQRALWPQKEY